MNEASSDEKEEIKKGVLDTEKVPSPIGLEDRMSFISGRPAIQSLLEEELASVGAAVSVNGLCDKYTKEGLFLTRIHPSCRSSQHGRRRA